jgi:hypothetical protein
MVCVKGAEAYFIDRLLKYMAPVLARATGNIVMSRCIRVWGTVLRASVFGRQAGRAEQISTSRGPVLLGVRGLRVDCAHSEEHRRDNEASCLR